MAESLAVTSGALSNTILVSDACAGRSVARHEASLVRYWGYLYKAKRVEEGVFEERELSPTSYCL